MIQFNTRDKEVKRRLSEEKSINFRQIKTEKMYETNATVFASMVSKLVCYL